MMAQIMIDKTPVIRADNKPAIMEIYTVVDVVLGIVNSGVNNGSKICELIVISKGIFSSINNIIII